MNEICIKAGEENAVSLISLENLSVLISSDTTLIYPACTLVWMYAIVVDRLGGYLIWRKLFTKRIPRLSYT